MKQYPVLSLRRFAMLWMVLFLHLSTSANGHQFDFKVTLKAEQVALKRVMKDIEKQTGLYFMYSATGSLRVNDPVSITVTNAKLEDVLETLMESRGISWTIMDKAIVLKAAAVKPKENKEAKESLFRTVSGSVLDKDGQPLPGATVQIKGTNIGTTTAVSGVFTIANVPMKQLIIQARYTGYETQEKVLTVEGSIVFNLKPSVSNLDETVVVAYGTASQRSVTGAVSVVKGEEIKTLPNLSFDKSLQGFVPGMRITSGSGQPGAGLSNMIVRGISTGTEALGGSTVRNPLIVIDGMQVTQDPFAPMGQDEPFTSLTNPLAQINPDDIAEITVLKDAAAIALYGSKASNGVILVTTKRGHVGKPKLTLNHQTDASFLPPQRLKTLNQQQYLELLYEAYKNEDATVWTDEAIRADLLTKFPYRVSGTDTSFYPESNWDREIMNLPAICVSNNLSLSGGTPAQTYYLNLEHTKQDGLIKGSSYERTSFRVNLDNKFTDWFKVGVTTLLSYNIQKTASTRSEAASSPAMANTLSPLLPIRDQNGKYIPYYSWGTYYDDYYPNPVMQQEYNFDHTRIYRGLTTLNADLSFLRHFNLSSSLGIDYMQTENKRKTDPRIYASGESGMITDYDTRNAGWLWNTALRYQNQFGQHHLDVLIAQEAQSQQTKYLSVAVRGAIAIVNPYYTDITNDEYGLYSYLGYNRSRKTLSQFVNLSYDFRKKYYVSASWRRDGVSVFGGDNPFGNYWSFGGAWVISEEPFMQSTRGVIDFLKLRGSVGLSGNAGAINSMLRYTQVATGIFLGEPSLQGVATPGNPDIQWETTRQWNAGLQIDLLRNRISIVADLYYKYTKDVIYQATIPSYTGYAKVYDNIGDIRNSGLEISLTGNIIEMKDFSWNIRGNWSINSNLLIKSYNKLNTITPLLANEEGREYNSYYMPVWMGINSENGAPQWKDAGGKITSDYALAKKEFVGKAQPDGFGSVLNTFRWKRLELGCQLYYQYGAYLYNDVYNQLMTDGKRPYNNLPLSAMDRWQKPGDVAANPIRIRNNANEGSEISTRYLEKSDYIRFKNLRLSWQFPKKWANNIHLDYLKVHAQVNNLAVWSINSDIDPDMINSGGGAGFAYPFSRTYSLGLNASF